MMPLLMKLNTCDSVEHFALRFRQTQSRVVEFRRARAGRLVPYANILKTLLQDVCCRFVRVLLT